jgi:hypothetical protein
MAAIRKHLEACVRGVVGALAEPGEGGDSGAMGGAHLPARGASEAAVRETVAGLADAVAATTAELNRLRAERDMLPALQLRLVRRTAPAPSRDYC